VHASKKSKLPEVQLKYAMYLEDEGRFKEAEESFVEAGKPKEAIDMYVHQQDWVSAMRVAENADPSSVSDVLVAQAKAAVERKDWVRAEALYVRAKKPELAVKAFKEAGRWSEAIKLTKEFLPHKLQEINAEYVRFQNGEYVPEQGDVSKRSMGEDLVAQARALEEGRDFSKAIDAYLRITDQHSSDHDFLEAAWENAVKIAMNHVTERTSEVVATVAHRLVEVSRFPQAAELYEGIDSYRQAVDVYIKGGLWKQARALARAQAPELVEAVEERYVQHMEGNQDGDGLVLDGKAAQSIDVYAKRGDWQKCLEVAQAQGPAMLLKYATLHGSVLMNKNDFVGAARIFGTYGTDVSKRDHINLYRRLYATILAEQPGSSAKAVARSELKELRAMLVKAIAAFKAAGEAPATVEEFERVMWAATILAAQAVASQQGLKNSTAKLSIAALKSVGHMPADKAFYEAGMACRAAGKLSMAFVFLNRYLDITEAIEEGDSHTGLDNSDFVDTEIPFDFTIPDKGYLSDEERERVRDFVLELSMNESVEQSLPLHEIEAIFRDEDNAKHALLADAVNGDRGRRQLPAYASADGDVESVIRTAIAQI